MIFPSSFFLFVIFIPTHDLYLVIFTPSDFHVLGSFRYNISSWSFAQNISFPLIFALQCSRFYPPQKPPPLLVTVPVSHCTFYISTLAFPRNWSFPSIVLPSPDLPCPLISPLVIFPSLHILELDLPRFSVCRTRGPRIDRTLKGRTLNVERYEL